MSKVSPWELEIQVGQLKLKVSILFQKYDSLITDQCLKHAIEVEPEKGYTKYMSLGQLLNGEEAAECFKKGIQLMIAQKVVGQKRVGNYI